jgi:nucleotide sugar dehydrogenase
MKIQIVGVGVVGSAQAYLATHLGHEVLGVDRGRTNSEYAKMVKEMEREVDVTFICTQESYVSGVIADLVNKEVKGLYVIKSTVPSGTTRNLMEKYNIHICHNPEFLIEKTALESVIHPSMVVIGKCCEAHAEMLKKFYSPLDCPIAVSTPTLTETVKLSLNAYLSTLISFWNEIDKISGALGISTREVADIVKLNPRVSGYGTEFFGSPFGGKCLPKDLDQLIAVSHQVGADAFMLEALKEFNKRV